MAVDCLLLRQVEHGMVVVGLDEVGDAVVEDRGAGGVDEGSDGGDFAGVDEEADGAVDVNFVVKSGVVCACGGRGGMDGNIGFDLSEYAFDVGFTGVVVVGGLNSVALRLGVEYLRCVRGGFLRYRVSGC